MDEEKLDEGFNAFEERKMLLYRFCRDDGLLNIGKELEIDFFEDKNRIRYDDREQAVKEIAREVEEHERLERLINEHEKKDNIRFDGFLGKHYDAKVEDDEVCIEEGPAFIAFEEVKKSVFEEALDDDHFSPLIRGILVSAEDRGDYLRTEFDSAVTEGKNYHDGSKFYPTTKLGLPEKITGVYTRSPNSGWKCTVSKELSPLIWSALDEVEEEKKGPVETPEAEVPSDIDRRIPKFKEVLDSVELSEEDIEEFEEVLSENEALDYWSDYVAPNIRFRDEAKEAVLCMLASPEDKHGDKGRANAIIYGPPGTGKTEIKNFLTGKMGAHSIDGSRVSKADLTYNKSTEEDGLLVRAHKGMAVIEEADKMDDDAMGAALTALGESGEIEIRNMRLPAEVRGIMLGNYESKEEIIKKHGEALFNRFEFVLKFDRLDEEELDETLDMQYRYFRKPKPKEDASRLKKYLKWVRDFEPEMKEIEQISEFKKKKLDEIENVREGKSVMSVAWTLARLNHRDVTLDDFKKAYEMVRGR